MNYQIQSVRFPKSKYTLEEAVSWLKKHGFKTSWRGKKVDETKNWYRFRQKDPKKKAGIEVKTFVLPDSNDIQYIIYYE